MIRTRLTLYYAAVFGLVLVALGVVIYATTCASLYHAVDAELGAGASFFRMRWPGMGRPGGRPMGPPPPRFEPPPRGSSIGAEGTGISPERIRRAELERRLTRPRSFDLAGNGFPNPDDRPWDRAALWRAVGGRSSFVTVHWNKSRIRVLSAPLRDDGKVIGVVQVASNLEQVDATVSKLLGILLAMIPVGLLITTLAGVFMTGRAMAPVASIARAAEEIEASNLSGRLPVEGKDEFASLATTFNSMLERLERSFRTLGEAYESQRRFVADASHELKTPLTAIKTRVGVAVRGRQEPERYREHLKAIGESADTMSSIVRDLLLLARSDEGRMELARKPVQAAALIGQALEDVRSLPARRLSGNAPDDLTLRVDPPLVVRVLVNLLTNAIRHTSTGGSVAVEARREGDSAVFEVRDDGAGIAPEDLPYVFERFYRSDRARDRETGGTGLGLAIVKCIVESHGGAIAIDSVLGKGTTVTVTIPLGVAKGACGTAWPM